MNIFSIDFLSLSGKIYVAWSWSPHDVHNTRCCSTYKRQIFKYFMNGSQQLSNSFFCLKWPSQMWTCLSQLWVQTYLNYRKRHPCCDYGILILCVSKISTYTSSQVSLARQQQNSPSHTCSVFDRSYLTEGSEWGELVVVGPFWTAPRPVRHFWASSTGSILLWCWRATCFPTPPGPQEEDRGDKGARYRWLREKWFWQITFRKPLIIFPVAVLDSVHF